MTARAISAAGSTTPARTTPTVSQTAAAARRRADSGGWPSTTKSASAASRVFVATDMIGPLVSGVPLEQLARDDQSLQFVRAAADDEQRRIAVVPLDREVLREAVASEDPH